QRPNHIWGCDITYIRLRHGWLYLVAVLDWYSRYVVSWTLDERLELGFVLDVDCTQSTEPLGADASPIWCKLFSRGGAQWARPRKRTAASSSSRSFRPLRRATYVPRKRV